MDVISSKGLLNSGVWGGASESPIYTHEFCRGTQNQVAHTQEFASSLIEKATPRLPWETDVSELPDLLDCHGPYLFRLLHRVTLREDVAEDLLQDLFLRLRASRGFASASNRRAYARRTALRLAFDWRRDQRRFRTSSLPEDEAAVGQVPPSGRLEDREEFEGVLEAMAGLSARNIELLTMRFIQQDSFETIGAHFGRTPHQVRALCHKALIQLRALIAETRPEILERHKP